MKQRPILILFTLALLVSPANAEVLIQVDLDTQK